MAEQFELVNDYVIDQNPIWLFYIGDVQLPSYIVIVISDYMDPY